MAMTTTHPAADAVSWVNPACRTPAARYRWKALRQRVRGPVKRTLQVAAAVSAAGVGSLIGFQPSLVATYLSTDGETALGVTSILGVSGSGLPAILAFPVVVALLPVAARGRAWPILSILSATVLTLFAVASSLTVVSSLTVGWCYLPAVTLALIGAFIESPRPRT
jgi:hypothetical protein